MSDSHQSTVLIVEDEPDLADTYALWLQESYAVRTAYDGRAALDQLDETVDIVLLDRRMPDLSGGEVLSAIRNREFDCQVAMVTAVEPAFDIVEMEFDAYLVKPIGKDELDDLVERLLARRQYDDRLQEFYALATKKAILDAEMTERERAASDEYAQLDAQLADVREQTDDALEGVFTQDGFPDVVNSLTNVDAEEGDLLPR
jgi:DNA-binding response OmpR family regulator